MKTAIAIAALLYSAAASAATPDQIEFFEKKIRPILAQECYECHSTATKQRGGLVLDSRSGWEQGGDSGAVINLGKPKASLLIQAIRHEHDDLKMPKAGAKLDERVLKDFETWVAMGAPDPRDKPSSKEEIAKDTDWASVLERRKTWWSFQPIQNPPVPTVSDAAWSTQPIDRFLRARMEAERLAPAPDADPRVLLRRLTFILIGLPPTPEDLDAFAAASAADPQKALEAAADRLLASPRYGERWARHWMDWMRYADTHGSEGDAAIPFAWRYRDYLVRALNADIPYPQLVREHIAGDLLDKPRINAELGINESALGGGHYRFVLHGFTPTDALDEQVTFTDNQIDVVSKAFLGVTVSCARCHNHKFDALSQTDFYAMYGIMASCRPATIDANLPEKQILNVDKLADLKPKIRAAIAERWLKDPAAAAEKLSSFKAETKTKSDPKADPFDPKTKKPEPKKVVPPPFTAWTRLLDLPPEKWAAEWKKLIDEEKAYRARVAAFRAQAADVRWDLRGDDRNAWRIDGPGVQRGPSPAGEFSVVAEGDAIIGGIYPSGLYSHTLSTKHRGVLNSPNFHCDGGKLFIRARGTNRAKARYVVRNYPRTGTIYLKKDLNEDADQWTTWDMAYWSGETLHMEITTAADQPVETDGERSWLGISEIIYTKSSDAAPPPVPALSLIALLGESTPAPKDSAELKALYSRALQRCITAWKAGSMNDDEAEFLAEFVRQGWLPNRLADAPDVAALVKEYRTLEAAVPIPTRAPGVTEGFAADQALFIRGDHKQPSTLVPRRFLEAIDTRPYNPGPALSGRRQLAESIVAPANPFASRVIVNRLWHHVFGRGIVPTPDNFGRLGEAPSHPELLDYLATQFQINGGSLKAMIRSMVTSRAFRTSHRPASEALERDPDNRLLTHFPMRRLEAEAIRDGMLSQTGKLDLALGGASVDAKSYRRALYLKIARNNLDPMLSAFDFPVPSSTRGARDATNVPAQSLTLMNAPLANQWAGDWAARILADKGLANDEARIRRMYIEAFAREPNADETRAVLAYLSSIPADPKSPNTPWQSLAQALFNAKEFIYVR